MQKYGIKIILKLKSAFYFYIELQHQSISIQQ